MQIVVFIFAVLSILGAWASWRQSPLYSLKATLKLIGIVLLIGLAVVLGAQAILSPALKAYPIVQGMLGLVAFMAVSIGASAAIIKVTDGHVAQLPPSVQLVHIHSHRVFRWIWRIVGLVVLCGALVLVLPDSWNSLPGILGVLVLVGCGPTMTALFMLARRNDRGMTSVIAKPWAHWQLTPEQWQAWAANQLAFEEAQAGPWVWRKVILFDLFVAALFTLGALLTSVSASEKVITASGLTGGMVLLTLIAYWFQRTHPGRRYRKLLKASPEVFFGDEGFFCNGEFMTWLFSGRFLLRATLTNGTGAASLQPVGIHQTMILVYQQFNGSTSIQVTKRIPVPDGHEDDLKLLQQRIDGRCPTASVHLARP